MAGNEDAFGPAGQICRKEGIFVGMSSGTAMYAYRLEAGVWKKAAEC